MILITGGAGFIGSAMVWELNQAGEDKILICDNWRSEDKWKNLQHLRFYDFVSPDNLFEFARERNVKFSHIIHLGACSNTTEKDMDFLYENNFRFSQEIWYLSIKNKANLIYASSAATYGDGAQGFDDDENKVESLRPLNKYGYSKQLFDKWVIKQKSNGHSTPPFYAGLKFFNVFGPNEYHKGPMASVVYHAFKQIRTEGVVKLFKSHKKDCRDGDQLRDFVYIKDVTKTIKLFLEETSLPSGIYNLGSGHANTFKNLVKYAFEALDLETKIKYIDIPEAIRNKYQYYTCANMVKLAWVYKRASFYSLKDAVADYVQDYLTHEDPYLK